MKNSYIRKIYTEFYNETGTGLSNINLDDLLIVQKYEANGDFKNALAQLIQIKGKFPYSNTKTVLNEERRLRLELIERLILSGRFEDAALNYETLGMWKEAGDTRKMSRTVKNVNVDVNQLIETVKKGGLGLQYKCGGCGASLQIDDVNNSKIRNCMYCGTAIDVNAMMEIIKHALR